MQQSSQVNLLPKRRFFYGIAVYCDARGISFLGVGVTPPEEVAKKLRHVFLYSERFSTVGKHLTPLQRKRN